jgi:transcriptional regulator with GAF, ATPase, and Fis domain
MHFDEVARLERLRDELSSALPYASGDSIERAIVDTIHEIVLTTGVDRAKLIELSEGESDLDITYQWTRPVLNVSPDSRGKSAPASVVLRLAAREGAVVFGPGTEGGPDGSTAGGAKVIGITVSGKGRRRCILLLEAFTGGRSWPDATIERLQLLGEVLAAAAHRVHHERAREDLGVQKLPLTTAVDRGGRSRRRALLSGFDEIVGESEPLLTTLSSLRQVAATDSTVLLLGETGTGKELFARAIHANSSRARHTLVSINCAALPPALVESELFGHERGAFTGAFAQRIGRFEQAHRGTLFLDEVGDLPLEIQVKLLRVLQQQTFERLGSEQTRTVDVRIVAATHRDLDALIADGQFRDDLFYRLSVFPIRVPPLRERREDIPALVFAIIQKRQQSMRRSITTVPQGIMDVLQAHSWPGNVRELENVIERALIHSTGSELRLTEEDLPVQRQSGTTSDTLHAVERSHIEEVLRACDWRINGAGNAAERLGLHPNTLRFRMKKLGITRSSAAVPPKRSTSLRQARRS